MKEKTKILELRSLIYGKYNSEAEFAKSIGWTKQKMNKITGGVTGPDISDINELAIGLGATVGEVVEIFLRHKSPNEQQSA